MFRLYQRQQVQYKRHFPISLSHGKELIQLKWRFVFEEHIEDLVHAAHEGVVILRVQIESLLSYVL